MAALFPDIRRSMSPALRASPQERRCSPSSQISPGLLTTEAVSHSLSTVSAGSEVFSSKSIAIWSISTGSKPVMEMSKPSARRSSAKLRKLDVEALPIPARIFGDLVVGQEQCALLSFAQAFENDYRHLAESEINRGRKATMPQQDCVVLIDYDRDHEAEGENAIADLADLLLGMRPRVTWIGLERMRRNPLDLMHNELLSRSGRRRASASRLSGSCSNF